MINGCSIVIPIFNEEKNIIKLKNLINEKFKLKNYEIIFVDDNSKDNSKKVLKKISQKNVRHFIRREKNDLCQSCFLGIKKSKYNIIVIMDGDLQHHPKYLNKLFNYILKKNKDLVVCSRSFKKRQNLSILRFFASKIIISIINLVLGYKVSDPMSGFFIFKKKIFLKNEKKFYGKGYKILFDIIYNCQNLKIDEININFYKRKFNKSKMSLNVLIHIIISLLQKFVNKKLT